MDAEAGQRLKAYVIARMAEQKIASVSALARHARVSRDTFQQWWTGRPPARGTGQLVATALGVTYADLVQAREGTTTGAGDTTLLPAAYLKRVDDLVTLVGVLVDELQSARRT